VHHEFYAGWLAQNDWAGWLVAGLATAVLLQPRSLPLFAAMLASSIVYNVRKWPFVVNHVFVESLIDATILAAIGAWWWEARRASESTAAADRDALFERFAPVLRAMLVLMYAFAFVAKLNRDFLNPHLSCVTYMFDNLVRRFPFVPDTDASRSAAIWGTLLIEGAIPVLFLIPRTRIYALLVGLPFHFMLGSIGHRTFSALAYALYGLFVLDALTPIVERGWQWAEARFGAARWRQIVVGSRVVAAVGIATLIFASKSGHYHAGIGPLQVHRIAWAVWGLWSLLLATAYVFAIRDLVARHVTHPAPLRWIHPMIVVVCLNGLSQYLGFKTETCFTMYSNLRTEAGMSNHLFIPALRLANYQDDLVDILATDAPELQKYIDSKQWMTYFEFQRFTSTPRQDFWVRYRHNNGPPAEFVRHAGVVSDASLARPHAYLASKLLYFRPVSKEDCVPCLH
jgi:hypothetical protein